MGAPLNHPDTPKWMVYFMENPMKVDDSGDPKMDGIFHGKSYEIIHFNRIFHEINHPTLWGIPMTGRKSPLSIRPGRICLDPKTHLEPGQFDVKETYFPTIS